MLPQECPPGQLCSEKMKERNMLMISANEIGELYVNKELIEIKNLKETIVKFIDNNGDKTCDYCSGDNDIVASDNPNLPAILIDVQVAAPYKHFTSIQDEITKSYEELRARYAKEIFNKNPDELTAAELKQVKEAYPFRIIEAAVE
ncbi:MAG: biopolymer transport protein ExbD [Candidatus Azotimanducaceae bacterium]|jgi:biopolymer transport protein ExbD